MHTPNYNFQQDLPIARKTEKQIALFLSNKLGMTFLDECNNADYDIRMKHNESGKELTIEIKEDFTCQKTGNIGVEYSSWGRKTGIQISKADYYLYKIHLPDGKKGVYIIKTSKLKDMIRNKLYHRIVNGGDPGSNSMNYLFRLNVVKEHFNFLGFVT